MTKTNKEKEDASKKRAASKKLTAQQQDLLCKHLILACTSKNASTNASNNVSNNASNNAATSATMIMQMEAKKDDTEEEEQHELNPKPMSTSDARSNDDGTSGKDNDENIHDTSAPLDNAPPGNDDPESMFDELKPVRPMKCYLQSLFKHLKYEIRNDFPVKSCKWLLEFLSENDCQNLAIKANSCLCHNLGIDFDEPSYYWDIVVWLPDLQFQVNPPCLNCGQGCNFHSWQTNHFGPVVISLYNNYFVISHHYLCTHCKEISKQMKASAICSTRQAVFICGATVAAIVDDVVDRTQNEPASVSTSNNKTPSDGLSDKDRSFSSMKGLDNENHQHTFMGYNA
jgi:hypothetical protein